MIKVQLCPFGELEDKNWWLVDVAVLLLVCLLGYWVSGAYLDIRRNETISLIAKKQRWDEELKAKEPAIAQFNGLAPEMELLNRKINALRRITTSKLDKVKPLVALDQLQTLSIQGVWYERLEYQIDGSLLIKGSGNDSLLIGEYMLGVRETMNPETYNDDVRTQVGFESVTLKNARYVEESDPFFEDIRGSMQFEMSGRHVEKKGSVHGISAVPRPRADAHF